MASHLIVLGGGDLPSEAIERLVRWSGGDHAKILVIPWASEEPPDASKKNVEAMTAHFHEFAEVSVSTVPPVLPLLNKGEINAAEKAEFLKAVEAELAESTGVYFSGGDQCIIGDAFEAMPEIKASLQHAYQRGVTFSGYSAGLAIMPRLMFTGREAFRRPSAESAQLDFVPGLALLPERVFMDSHFFQRRRDIRLKSAMLTGFFDLGIGVDAGMAVEITDNRYAEVVGEGVVQFTKVVTSTGGHSGRPVFHEILLGNHEKWDLVANGPLEGSPHTEGAVPIAKQKPAQEKEKFVHAKP